MLIFTTLTLVATLLHLDRLHLTSSNSIMLGTAWAWIAIYGRVPPALTSILVVQLHTPGGDPPRHATLPAWLRLVVGFQAGVMLVLGLAFFLVPSAALDLCLW